eukprot:gene8211-11111_t
MGNSSSSIRLSKDQFDTEDRLKPVEEDDDDDLDTSGSSTQINSSSKKNGKWNGNGLAMIISSLSLKHRPIFPSSSHSSKKINGDQYDEEFKDDSYTGNRSDRSRSKTNNKSSSKDDFSTYSAFSPPGLSKACVALKFNPHLRNEFKEFILKKHSYWINVLCETYFNDIVYLRNRADSIVQHGGVALMNYVVSPRSRGSIKDEQIFLNKMLLFQQLKINDCKDVYLLMENKKQKRCFTDMQMKYVVLGILFVMFINLPENKNDFAFMNKISVRIPNNDSIHKSERTGGLEGNDKEGSHKMRKLSFSERLSQRNLQPSVTNNNSPSHQTQVQAQTQQIKTKWIEKPILSMKLSRSSSNDVNGNGNINNNINQINNINHIHHVSFRETNNNNPITINNNNNGNNNSNSIKGESSQIKELKDYYINLLNSYREYELDDMITSGSWLKNVHQFIENSPYSVSIACADIANPGFPLLYVNKAFEKMTLFDRDMVIGKNLNFLQSNKTEPDQVKQICEALKNAKPVKIGITNIKRDGVEYYNFLSLKPVFNNEGVFSYVIGIQYDLTGKHASLQDIKLIDELIFFIQMILT